MSVRAVGADQVVLLAHHRGGAEDRRLLADRQMEEAARFGSLVLTPGLLLEAPDQAHPREQLVTGGGVGEIGHVPEVSSPPPLPPPACRRPRKPRRRRAARARRTLPDGQPLRSPRAEPL